ncbi:uncharacterized protein LOC113528898 [Pangasianodon hypophthalmus]|uniref:uncharacterized protein LOC113528898 n=1 Tax=Pangasianodon hypophthalmus TaxID=310915 RepID=UPI00230788B7|nr:uncharacterized protein LOC113528898 [Pangasianodon hypophthalmus]XP_053091438.1 uncharacterized protein LOC113528898 [Pangasianodon hypophthalmus]XP_053091439.1 uncharacterized protein LOC113528898 [Pangasianodon hypophthalmus]XP_053091440.1 uncharacterized protein LOC113528898 [Pangasianodon hypophthalmus]XP_053091441.1 uncharacterized protein LOC113528898 [Pangasianodon hypophthalmus]XP_053091442.1 uncharacterized protein LOC113528898 [Pangasianodon hypophthalmus]
MLVTKKKIGNRQGLTLYSKPMKRVGVFKYHGLMKNIHGRIIENIETKCKKVLNLMRRVVGCVWGADKEALLQIYRALMRATLDYGCMVCEAAAKIHLEKLDRIQYRVLRLSLGAVKTTPINALLVESNELPLHLRRNKLSLPYWIRIQGGGNGNLASIVLQNCWESTDFSGEDFGWDINKKMKQYKLDTIQHSPAVIRSGISPRIFTQLKVNFQILKIRREWTERNYNIGYLVQEYLKKSYYNYLNIFTDGSKHSNNEYVVGIYIPEFDKGIAKRISNRLQPLAKIMESPQLFYFIANKQITDMTQKRFCSIA